MKSQTLPPIPVPVAQRLRDARTRLLPIFVMVSALAAIAGLWRNHVAAPTMVGQAQGDLATISSPKSGMLTALHVARFQKVHAGDLLGHVMVADPRLLETSLAVIRAEIEALRAGLRPLDTQQRNAIDYVQLRLDWIKQRAALASAQVNLQLAETELRRTEVLLREKIATQQSFDEARARRDALQREVDELTRLVAEGERSFKVLQPGDTSGLAVISDEPLRAAIAVQEAKLRMTEADLSPFRLQSPIDGTVTAIHHHSGEAVRPGQPILEIAADQPSHIVAYLRQPVQVEPKRGQTVQIRTRNGRRSTATGQVLHIGARLDTLPAALQSPVKLAGIELGLPVSISLPRKLKLRPAELVDIMVAVAADENRE